MTAPLHLFAGYGLELEYMIVDRATLAVRPIADQLLAAVLGHIGGDYEDGPIAWSNELVLHVIELKNNGPVPSLAGVAEAFAAEVRRIDALLEPHGAMLLPTGMHPLMDPLRETVLWPHEASPIYNAYDRIFGCRGHGWSNLQSMHVNLPFCGDDEFGALHAAIRAVLPLLPALAASSPLVEGAATGLLDNRLEFYRHNQALIPSIAGSIVPEQVFSERDYRAQILERTWRDIDAHDPEHLLRREFLNSRGAIARFERDAIEIRVLDTQEAPIADVANALLIAETLRMLVSQRHVGTSELKALATEPLAALLLAAVRSGEETVVDDASLLAALGWPGGACRAGELWQHLAAETLGNLAPALQPLRDALEVHFREGCLARRILHAVGTPVRRTRIVEVYRRLAECLRTGELFRSC